MITESQMYWLTRMDAIREGVEVLSIFCALVALICFVVAVCEYIHMSPEPSPPELYRSLIPIKAAILLFGLLTSLQAARAFIPTTRELAAIKVVPMIANNEDMKGLGNDVMELAREWVKELKQKPKVEKEAKE